MPADSHQFNPLSSFVSPQLRLEVYAYTSFTLLHPRRLQILTYRWWNRIISILRLSLRFVSCNSWLLPRILAKSKNCYRIKTFRYGCNAWLLSTFLDESLWFWRTDKAKYFLEGFSCQCHSWAIDTKIQRTSLLPVCDCNNLSWDRNYCSAYSWHGSSMAMDFYIACANYRSLLASLDWMSAVFSFKWILQAALRMIYHLCWWHHRGSNRAFRWKARRSF